MAAGRWGCAALPCVQIAIGKTCKNAAQMPSFIDDDEETEAPRPVSPETDDEDDA